MLNNTYTLTHPDDGIAETVVNRRPTSNPAALGKFISTDGLRTLEIRQKQTRNRKRSEYVLTTKKIATDPLTSGLTEVSASIFVSVDQPKLGFNATTDLYPLILQLTNFVGGGGTLFPVLDGDT